MSSAAEAGYPILPEIIGQTITGVVLREWDGELVVKLQSGQQLVVQILQSPTDYDNTYLDCEIVPQGTQ